MKTKYLILKFPLLPTGYLNPFSAPGKQINVAISQTEPYMN